jgi:hypothetical protein
MSALSALPKIAITLKAWYRVAKVVGACVGWEPLYLQTVSFHGTHWRTLSTYIVILQVLLHLSRWGYTVAQFCNPTASSISSILSILSSAANICKEVRAGDYRSTFPCYCSFVSLIRWKCYTTRAVCKVRGLTLLLREGTSWRCGDGISFDVPPLKSDVLLTTLHPLFENVLQTVDYFEISCLGAPFHGWKSPEIALGGGDLNWILCSAWKSGSVEPH